MSYRRPYVYDTTKFKYNVRCYLILACKTGNELGIHVPTFDTVIRLLIVNNYNACRLINGNVF